MTWKHCWNQVANLDRYAAGIKEKTEERMALALIRHEDLGRGMSMAEDYMEGTHDGLVEIGGFVRHPAGLSMGQRASMNTMRANLASYNSMGTPQFHALVRPGAHAEAPAKNDSTDETPGSMKRRKKKTWRLMRPWKLVDSTIRGGQGQFQLSLKC